MNDQIRLREEINKKQSETAEYLATHKVRPEIKQRILRKGKK